jgi:hypothetical protein
MGSMDCAVGVEGVIAPKVVDNAPVYECAQCQDWFVVPSWERHVWRNLIGDDRAFCDDACKDEYEMRQGELQMERRLS